MIVAANGNWIAEYRDGESKEPIFIPVQYWLFLIQQTGASAMAVCWVAKLNNFVMIQAAKARLAE